MWIRFLTSSILSVLSGLQNDPKQAVLLRDIFLQISNGIRDVYGNDIAFGFRPKK